jgi:mono/diheme cytochrome c family protein
LRFLVSGSAQIGGWLDEACRFPVLLLASAATAQAQDPQEGAKWAVNVCGECHAVARNQPHSPNVRAPSFVELANAPGMTTAALTVALTTPHAGMPMFVLTSEQRQDIIAYILSLRPIDDGKQFVLQIR